MNQRAGIVHPCRVVILLRGDSCVLHEEPVHLALADVKTVRHSRDPQRIANQNQMFVEAYNMAAQAQQFFPVSALFRILNLDGKDKVLPVIEENEHYQEQMQALQQQVEQMSQQMEQMQQENQSLRQTTAEMANTLSTTSTRQRPRSMTPTADSPSARKMCFAFLVSSADSSISRTETPKTMKKSGYENPVTNSFSP